MGDNFDNAIVKQARTADLLSYLRANHAACLDKRPSERVWRISGTDFLISEKKPDSCFNLYDPYHSSLNAIDSLIQLLDYKFIDAVAALTSASIYIAPRVVFQTIVNNQKEIQLPERGETYKHIFGYLENRNIPQGLIKILISENLLYEDVGNNIVFVNRQKTAFEARGTNTIYEATHCKEYEHCLNYDCGPYKSCNKCNDCPNYKPLKYRRCDSAKLTDFWYFDPLPSEYCKNIYICEAAIDAISLYVLIRDMDGVYVSMSGSGKTSKVDFILKKYSNKNKKIFIATDNDPAGNRVAEKYSNLKRLTPYHTDWNEDLQDMRQLAQIKDYMQQFLYLFE